MSPSNMSVFRSAVVSELNGWRISVEAARMLEIVALNLNSPAFCANLEKLKQFCFVSEVVGTGPRRALA